jgi:hypothetical protein
MIELHRERGLAGNQSCDKEKKHPFPYLIRSRVVVLSVTVCVAAVSSAHTGEIAEVGGGLCRDARSEVHHGAIRTGVAADHPVRIVAGGAADAVVVTVGRLVPDRTHVVALVAQSGACTSAASTTASARRVLKQIQLQQVRVDGAVRSVRSLPLEDRA